MARGMYVWFNGKIQPNEEVKLNLFTHSLHYGLGAFEGIRAYRQSKGGGAVFRLHDHFIRLFESCKILNIKIPYTLEDLIQGTLELCRRNQFDECYIRPIVFIGDTLLGVYPGENPPIEVAILSWEWGQYITTKTGSTGVRLKISSFIRPHVNSTMTRGKITGQYVTGVLAKQEAISLGFDEALLLDAEGYLTEGTGENLFLIKNNIIKTTGLTSILNGITRQTVIEYFRHHGFTIQETRFTRDELWCSDEVFLTGTAAEITPVEEIDGRIIGTGALGPITKKLQEYFHNMVRGHLPSYGKNWLTSI